MSYFFDGFLNIVEVVDFENVGEEGLRCVFSNFEPVLALLKLSGTSENTVLFVHQDIQPI